MTLWIYDRSFSSPKNLRFGYLCVSCVWCACARAWHWPVNISHNWPLTVTWAEPEVQHLAVKSVLMLRVFTSFRAAEVYLRGTSLNGNSQKWSIMGGIKQEHGDVSQQPRAPHAPDQAQEEVSPAEGTVYARCRARAPQKRNLFLLDISLISDP